jgi:hypothetical protein
MHFGLTGPVLAAYDKERRNDMEGIKAKIHGEGVNDSVEFSIEEVIARTGGKPWGEMSAAEQEAALKDYALALFTRDSGVNGRFDVNLEGGTFSTERNRDA